MKNKRVIIFYIVIIIAISLTSCSQETKENLTNWLKQSISNITVIELILIVAITNLITK